MPLFSRGKRDDNKTVAAKKPARTPPPEPASRPEPPQTHAPRTERRATDNPGQVEDANAVQARLREDLNELLTAHRHQGRVLERNEKLLEQAEHELAQLRTRLPALEREIADQRALAGQRGARIQELEAIGEKHQTLKTAYEALDREREDLRTRIADLTRSNE